MHHNAVLRRPALLAKDTGEDVMNRTGMHIALLATGLLLGLGCGHTKTKTSVEKSTDCTTVCNHMTDLVLRSGQLQESDKANIQSETAKCVEMCTNKWEPFHTPKMAKCVMAAQDLKAAAACNEMANKSEP